MPIHEYSCPDCGNHIEVLQKISEDWLTVCPECKKSGLKRLVSAAGFKLKGSGWYETDFKTKPKADPKPPTTESKKTDDA